MIHPTFTQIKSLQKGYKVTEIQNNINSGLCWKLEAGVCMLPLVRQMDAYGTTVPARNDLKAGSKGTYLNAQNFWAKIWDGDDEAIEWLENNFGRDEEDEVE